MDVGLLLEQARAAHLEYRRFTPHKRSIAGRLVDVAGDPVRAREALERAGTFRKAAQDADPNRTDPAWVQDEAAGHPHDAVLTFYGEQAAKPMPADVAMARRAETPTERAAKVKGRK